MSKPLIIRRGRGSQLSLWQRIRKRCERTWSEYVLNRRKRRYRRTYATQQPARIAFVFGCQRSGTTMLMQMLGRSLDIDRIDENDPRGFDDCRILSRETRVDILKRSSAQCVVFKPICDSHRALELYAEHSDSKGIWIYRDYVDVANSSVHYWGDQTRRYILDLMQGGGDWGVAQWNREKIGDEHIAEIAQAAADGLSDHDAAALFWFMRNQTFFDQALSNHEDTLLIRYEDIIREPHVQMERICQFLNLEFAPDMVFDVFGSSVRRHRAPLFNTRVRALCDAMAGRLESVLLDHSKRTFPHES